MIISSKEDWEVEKELEENSTTFVTSDHGGNTIIMGSSIASLGDSSWANAELEDIFEAASPKKNNDDTPNNEKDDRIMITSIDIVTPRVRQRSTVSMSEFEREGLLKPNKCDSLSPSMRGSIHNPLISPRERKGLKKCKSERFTGLETKKNNRPSSLRDINSKNKDVGKMSSGRRSPKRSGSERDLKSLNSGRKAKDCFESSDWLSSCYVDSFDKEIDKEPKRRTRTIAVEHDSKDDDSHSYDDDKVKGVSNRDGLSRTKASGSTKSATRPSLHRIASMPSVQQRTKEDPPGHLYSKTSNYVWNDNKPTADATSSSTTKVHSLVRSSSSCMEGSEGKDRRGRFGLPKAFQSFRQLPIGATTPTNSNKKASLKSVLRGAVQVVEKQPSTLEHHKL